MDNPIEPFQEPDAFLADEMPETLRNYLDKNGQPTAAFEALSDNYEGTPDIIRILVDWSDLYTDGSANLESAIESVLIENEPTVVSRLDEALASTEQSLPVITAITASSRWNPVVSAMAGRNRESALHNLLTRETRLSQAGISQTVLQSPQSFLNAIIDQFNTLLSDGRPVTQEELDALYKRVSAMCTYDECGTLVALRLFNTLAKEAEDPYMRGLYRRVAQEVRIEAENVMQASSIASESVAHQYVTRLAIITEAVSSDVVMRKPIVDALLSLLDRSSAATRRRFEPETKVLLDCYGRLIGDIGPMDGDGEVVESVIELDYEIQEKVVLIRMLCHMEIFEDILKSLFSHEYRTYLDGRPDHGKRRCLCLLLSYAGVFICKDERELPVWLMNTNRKEQLRQEIHALYNRLERTTLVCEDLKPGCPRFKIKGKAVEVLLDAVKDPLLARGILMWAREGVHGGSDLRALIKTAPKHLAFLEAIAQNHPVLREDVLNIIREAFLRDYPGLEINFTENLRDMFMKTITGLVHIQMAPQIVQDFRTSWASDEKVDHAHLRRFISELLQMISPPYSHAFAASVLELLGNERVAAAVDKDVKTGGLVLNFRQQATAMGLG